MYEQFDDQARRVMENANEEARSRYNEFIGTEHVLMALAKIAQSEEGDPAERFRELSVQPETVIRWLEKVIMTGPVYEQPQQLGLTRRMKLALEHASGSAREHSAGVVGTANLLHGLLLEKEGVAAQLLCDLRTDALRASTTTVPPETAAH